MKKLLILGGAAALVRHQGRKSQERNRHAGLYDGHGARRVRQEHGQRHGDEVRSGYRRRCDERRSQGRHFGDDPSAGHGLHSGVLHGAQAAYRQRGQRGLPGSGREG